ncbi:MAG: hypothetical protein IH898_06325 [Planctomycetes bacterium]|nr:hypothetical protein [Planctomycetota bacterium]
MTIKTTWFNGSPGLVVWHNEKPVTAFSFELEHRAIRGIYAHRSPDKLRLFGVF